MSNKLVDKESKKKTTWNDVFFYAILGSWVDSLTESWQPKFGDGDMDEWGKNKASMIRYIILLIIDVVWFFIFNYPEVFQSDNNNRVTIGVIYFGIQIIVAILCVVNIYKKAKYKRKK